MFWVLIAFFAIYNLRASGSFRYEVGNLLYVRLAILVTAFCIIGSCCPRMVKYFSLIVFLQRCTLVYVMLKLIDFQISQLSDKKLLQDAIFSLFVTWYALLKFYP